MEKSWNKQKFGFPYMEIQAWTWYRRPGAELLRQENSDKYDFIFTNWYTYRPSGLSMMV